MTSNSKVRVRFAPSPTGYLHIGGARTAIFNAVFAEKTGGTFILRIEDTDRERSTDEAVEAILEGMHWLGLKWDEGPIFQTQRFDRYKEKVAELVAAGNAYPCFCTAEAHEAARTQAMAEKRKPKYPGVCRQLSAAEREAKKTAGLRFAIRFKAPEAGETIVKDLVRGEVRFANTELDDLIIARSDGTPTYNFTVVVDDAEMAITHVIRGDDHLNNTPRQIALYEAMGYAVPAFVHVPMILGADKKRLSKRHGATSVIAYRDMGYLPEALFNYLSRLGWSMGDQEVFSRAEMVAAFSLEDLQKSAAVFNPEKLLWMNGVYIRNLPLAELTERVRPYLPAAGISTPEAGLLLRAVAACQEKAKTLVELAEMLGMFFKAPTRASSTLWADLEANAEACAVLRRLSLRLSAHLSWEAEALKAEIHAFCEGEGIQLKAVAQPLRVVLSGLPVSPGIFDLLAALGKEESLRRLGALLG